MSDKGITLLKVRYTNGRLQVKGVGKLWIVHQTHYYEDGSEFELHYLELTKEQFDKVKCPSKER